MKAINFIDSMNTKIFQYIRIILKKDQNNQLGYIPFMEDYNKLWTDKMFIDYF